MTLLLKICFATPKKVKLNFVFMTCIKTNDGIHDIVYTEERDVDDNSVSDIRGLLLTFDLDFSNIYIDKLTCMGNDRNMRCKRWRCNWRYCSCIYECCPRLLKMMRETGTYGVRKWSTSLFDPWLWADGAEWVDWCWVNDHWIRLLGQSVLRGEDCLSLGC